MDQQKIGAFLKQLRKEKDLTQEELAEKFYISSKTVSRWETGSRVPDLTTLVELAEFYEVDIRELIYGEHQTDPLDNISNDTLKKVAEYAKEEKEKEKKKFNKYMIILALIFPILVLYTILFAPPFTGLLYNKTTTLVHTFFWMIMLVVCYISFSLLQEFKKSYIKESEIKKHKIINIIYEVLLLCAAIGIETTDKHYGLLISTLPNNLRVTINVISFILFAIVSLYFFYVFKRYLNSKKNNEKQE